MPIKKIIAQNPRPPKVYPLDSPFTIVLIKSPSKNPEKFPIANSNPTAAPYPTGKANSHPNSSIIGTKGIKKNELKAEIPPARKRDPVYNKG